MSLDISALKDESEPSREQARVFQQFLGIIEALRVTRQENYREKPHPQLKRFTQQELNDEACPTYKNWLTGRSHRLPNRSMLMAIADYLECSLRERNDLLLAAQYLPEQPEWRDDALRRALEPVQQIMETLPYPAIVVTHTLQVQAANKFFLRLFELSSLDTVPPYQRSMIHFLLHPNVCRQAGSMMNADAHTLWQNYTLYALQFFQQQNVLSQYDAWYQQRVQQWCDDIPVFQAYWEKAREETQPEDAPIEIMLARTVPIDEAFPIRVRQMLVSVSNKIYPAALAFLPIDEAARAVYNSLGCVASEPSSVD